MTQHDELDALIRKVERSADRALHMARDARAEARVSATVTLESRLAGNAEGPCLANRLENATMEIFVSKNGRSGCAAVNGFDTASLRDAVSVALSLAGFSLPAPYPTLATMQQAPAAEPLGFQYDPALATMAFDELREVMTEASVYLTRDPRVLLERYEGEMSVGWRTVRNTLGVVQTEKRTSAAWNFLGMALDGQEVTGSDYEANFSFNHADLRHRCLDSATLLRQRLSRELKARQPPSYQGPVLLAPRAVHDLLLGAITHHASGRTVMDATSRWADSIGKQVSPASCTLIDKPRDKRFAAATAFDQDGVPTRPTSIVQHGVLTSHLHDVCSAASSGEVTTGHSNREFCLEMAAGPSPLSGILGSAPRLLLVHRFAGNADPISGHYSGLAKSSRLYLHGADAGSVTETMIAGDLSDLIRCIRAVSCETEHVHGEYVAPYVLVDAVSVTGG